MPDSKTADPLQPAVGEVRAILVKLLDHEIGAAAADEQILRILFERGHASEKQISPMKVCFHRLNRGGVIGNSMEVHPLM